MSKVIIIVLGFILIAGMVPLGVLFTEEINKVAQAESELVVLENEAADLEEKVITLEDSLSTMNDQLTDLQAEVSNLENQLNDSQTKVSDLETQLDDSQSTVSKLENQLDDSRSSLSDLETQLSTSQAEISSLQGELDTAHVSIETQQTLNQNLTDELKVVTDPRHFNSVSDLIDWLAQDDTDSAFPDKYGLEKCYILQVRALRDGFMLPAWFADTNDDKIIDYAGNIAHIDNKIYHVSASNDNIHLLALTDPVSPHPLPMN